MKIAGSEKFLTEGFLAQAKENDLDPSDFVLHRVVSNNDTFIVSWLPKVIQTMLESNNATLPDYKVIEITGFTDGSVLKAHTYLISTWE